MHRDVAHCCTDICTGAGLYGQGLWRVSLGERQLLLRITLTGSLTFIGSVIAVLVKYLSAWDECSGKGIESPSGSNVIDGIGVANPFQNHLGCQHRNVRVIYLPTNTTYL